MAENFTVIGQRRTVIPRGPTNAEDVEEVTVVTKPSGVQFVRDIPYDTWLKRKIGPLLSPIATHIEQVMKNHPVSSAGPTEDVGDNGLITHNVEFTVYVESSDPARGGLMTATVTIPVQALHDLDDFTSYFTPVMQALKAAAAL